MNWTIEHIDGSILHETRDLFNVTKSIYRIYLEENDIRLGFYGDGKFFINNTIYDFKIDINNYHIKPIQYKTGMMLLDRNQNGIHSYNIGYELINGNKRFKYVLSIRFDNKIIFTAEEYLNNILINNKSKLL
jgi:hypothetical protein